MEPLLHAILTYVSLEFQGKGPTVEDTSQGAFST